MKYLLYFAFAVISVLFFSCSEDFSPKSDIADKYVLYAVFSPSDFYSDVYISRVYDIDGYDPSKFSIEPAVKAKVTLQTNSHTYDFPETRYRNESRSVYSNIIDLIKPNEKATITAVLQDGTVLTANAVSLNQLYLVYSYAFGSGFTTKMSHFLWGSSFKISWPTNKTNDMFFASFSVYYSEMINGVETFLSKKIPVKFIKQNGAYEAVYPSSQYEKEIAFDYAAIDTVVAGLSNGESDKSKFKLYWMSLQILEFDPNLSSYYASIYGYSDRFSVRVDESVYSNVAGGIGVFGMKCATTNKFYINPDYAALFGYQYSEW
jgi:hypothetical protein